MNETEGIHQAMFNFNNKQHINRPDNAKLNTRIMRIRKVILILSCICL